MEFVIISVLLGASESRSFLNATPAKAAVGSLCLRPLTGTGESKEVFPIRGTCVRHAPCSMSV
jgi:hypothetical protein